MDTANDLSSSLSFVSSSYLSNGSSGNNISSTSGSVPETNLELLSLSKLSGSLEKLLLDSDFDYSDVEIVVEDRAVGVNRCILAARSTFFHQLFKKGDDSSVKEGKPRYQMSALVPCGRVGYEAFMVVLNYLYTGKLKPSPPEVSTCVDDACVHDACGPAIRYAVELMYASATFRMKELVMLVQRHLLNFVEKALVEDVIAILVAAFHCELKQLLSHCLQRVARSNLDDISVEKELPHEVLSEFKSIRIDSQKEIEACTMELESLKDKRVRRILKALDSDDVDLVNLLLVESGITLDEANALHYAVAYCDPKVVREVLNLGTVSLNLTNSRGYTVLHVAARRKDPRVIVWLLNKGACVSDSVDGQTAVTICRRLTRPKDYNVQTKHSEDSNKDRLCIDVLEREMRRSPIADNICSSSTAVTDDLHMSLILFENRVAFARVLFPAEATIAMETAYADSTSEFAGFSASKDSCGNFRKVDLNEMPSEQVKSMQSRLAALKKTVETGRRFFPHCSEVLDNFLDQDDLPDAFFLEKGSPKEKSLKRMRFMELKDEVIKAFDKDKAENKWKGLPSSSSSTSSPRGSANHKVRKR